MAERRYEELDRAIMAIVSGATEIDIRRDLEPLVSIAADLRDLPRPAFRERLRESLEKGEPMSVTGEVNVREVIPYLVLARAEAAVDFVKDVFGAEEVMRAKAPGGLHCELRLRGRRLMIGGGTSVEAPSPGSLHLFIDDVDAAYARAIAAGARSLHAPVDQEYGLREASVEDPSGNQWYIARDLGHGDFWSGVPALMPYFHPAGAARMIDFLRDAVGAEVLQRFDETGAVVHARLRIGQSVVEMGEAHGAYPAMPMHLFVAVGDADAAYARALAGGGTSAFPPSDAPYGRVGAVDDPSGNRWYFVVEK